MATHETISEWICRCKEVPAGRVGHLRPTQKHVRLAREFSLDQGNRVVQQMLCPNIASHRDERFLLVPCGDF